MTASAPIDPPLAERVWYRHAQTGDRGYAVKRLGKDAVRYDRPNVDDVSFELKNWHKETDEVPQFSALAIAQVAYEADRKLCFHMGRFDLAKREWLEMTDKQRRTWVEKGPPGAPRAELYAKICEVLRGK